MLRVNNLTMEIGSLHLIAVDELNGANAGTSEVECSAGT
jgi:hypothetical protein